MAKSKSKKFDVNTNTGSASGKLAKNDTGSNRRKRKVTGKIQKRVKQKEELERIVQQSESESKKNSKQRQKKSKIRFSEIRTGTSLSELFSTSTLHLKTRNSRKSEIRSQHAVIESLTSSSAVQTEPQQCVVKKKAKKGKRSKPGNDVSKDLPLEPSAKQRKVVNHELKDTIPDITVKTELAEVKKRRKKGKKSKSNNVSKESISVPPAKQSKVKSVTRNSKNKGSHKIAKKRKNQVQAMQLADQDEVV